MMSRFALKCKDVATHGLCSIVSNAAQACKCSCSTSGTTRAPLLISRATTRAPTSSGRAAPALSRRLQIVFTNHSACPMQSFGQRTKELNAQCCNPSDPDDDCSNIAVPKTCDVECAQTFVPFYRDCMHLLRAVMPVNKLPQFAQLNKTCVVDMPRRPMIDALSKADCYNTSAQSTGGPSSSPTSHPTAEPTRTPASKAPSVTATRKPTTATPTTLKETRMPTIRVTKRPTRQPSHHNNIISNVFGDHMVRHDSVRDALPLDCDSFSVREFVF